MILNSFVFLLLMKFSRAKTFAQLPLSSCPFKLSITYIHLFLSRYRLEVFSQAYSHLRNYSKTQVQHKDEGK